MKPGEWRQNGGFTIDRLRVGSLFSGIGGLDLGLERTGGFRVAWQCEINPYAQKVLEKHWPGIPLYPDVTRLNGAELEPVDVICGGFPCQDISYAGRGAGLDGARSGLFFELMRIVREVRPRYVIMENVPGLLTRGIDRVLGSLALCGYDAEWDCISAASVGALHRRDRIFIVAHSVSSGAGVEEHRGRGQERQPSRASESEVLRQELGEIGAERTCSSSEDVADPEMSERKLAGDPRPGGDGPSNNCYVPVASRFRGRGRFMRRYGEPSDIGPLERGWRDNRLRAFSHASREWWAIEPDVGRVANGVPSRVDRLRTLGNAVVPQVGEYIGRCIIEYERGDLNVSRF